MLVIQWYFLVSIIKNLWFKYFHILETIELFKKKKKKKNLTLINLKTTKEDSMSILNQKPMCLLNAKDFFDQNLL